jgi:uncharacterized protein YdcH (DUF465 family)
MDTIIHEQEGKIIILENQVKTQYSNFQSLLKIESEKLVLQKEITVHTENIVSVYQQEKASLKKQVRRLKWQRLGLGLVSVVAIGLAAL